jgi:transcriptional regulator with XRE-family HTH domain
MMKYSEGKLDPIVKRLQSIIKGMGLTPKDVAARTGLSANYVRRLMKKKKGTMYFRTVGRILVGIGKPLVPIIGRRKVTRKELMFMSPVRQPNEWVN